MQAWMVAFGLTQTADLQSVASAAIACRHKLQMLRHVERHVSAQRFNFRFASVQCHLTCIRIDLTAKTH